MKLSTKCLFTRIGLLVGSIAVILLLLPHDDRQSYNYELNQPWRYQLLTADFDMPILRDSTSARLLRDSLDRAFVPFVVRDNAARDQRVSRFSKAITEALPPQHARILVRLLEQAYARGIVDTKLYDRIHSDDKETLRMASSEEDKNTVMNIDASQMMSQPQAFRYIDSLYRAEIGVASDHEAMDNNTAHLIGAALTPNIVIDSVTDNKFREQEYLTVNGALGVIKKGQRIVDRGEIVTPQIFTNLNTYVEIASRDRRDDNTATYYLLGQGLYILVVMLCLFTFLYVYRPSFFASDKKMLFLVSFIVCFVAFAILMFEYVRNGLYFVPFAAIPVVILVFFDSRIAIFSLIVTVMLSALVSVFPFSFIFMELAAGLTAALSIHTLTRRSQLLRTALLTFVAYTISYVIVDLITEGTLSPFEWRIIGAFAINSVILSFVYFLVFIIERMYGFTSTVTLVELSDINSPLLRRLAEEAPGTFQHSMQVSTLAAEAARAVGANTQLVRTGALYHDIGKLDSPIFFTENQHGINPHTGLNPETSAQKIISHVTSGLALAQREKLPEMIRNFISEHHGRSVARYFYNTAVNANNDPDHPVDKAKFTYPGPNPQSRETAILMMADAVEAASRSLPEYTPEAISALVDRIVDTQVKEGLLNESPISFRDIQTIKDTFKKRLSTIYHSRVAYPELKKHEPISGIR